MYLNLINLAILVNVFCIPWYPSSSSSYRVAYALPVARNARDVAYGDLEYSDDGEVSSGDKLDGNFDYQGDMPEDDLDQMLLLALTAGAGNGTAFRGSLQKSSHIRHANQKKVQCSPTPPQTLRRWMGPAFNPRYMSARRPRNFPSGEGVAPRRRVYDSSMLGDEPDDDDDVDSDYEEHGDFVVDKGFRRHLPEDSKYIQHEVTETQSDNETDGVVSRRKRSYGLGGFSQASSSTSNTDEPWKCQSRVIWHDLGDNFYPRYLRHLECQESKCYLGLFECRERSFTLKVLKRTSDECVPVYANDNDHEPVRYEHEWIFEERAVSFCCECRTISYSK